MGGGKGGGGQPVTDPYELMDAAARYNRLNQYTPSGSVEFSGPDRNTVTVTNSPEQQALLEGQQGLTLGALQQMQAMGGAGGSNPNLFQGGGAAFAPLTGNMNALAGYLGGLPTNGLDLGSLAAMPGGGDFSADRARTEQAQFARAMNLIQPMQEKRTAAEGQMLSNRGVPETAKLAGIMSGRREADYGQQMQRAALDAVAAGGEEQSRLAGLGFQARGQGLQELLSNLGAQQGVRGQLFGELMQQYGLGRGEETEQFNRLAALLGMSQVNAPGAAMQGFWGPGQVDPNAANSSATQAWGQQQQYSMGNQMMELAGSLGGAALMGSSVEIKKDFTEVDYDDVLEAFDEIEVPRWRYQWEHDSTKHIGPTAEKFTEAFKVPEATIEGVRAIDMASALGVAFAAIKALKRRVEELEAGG
jgi:hypothetical protein